MPNVIPQCHGFQQVSKVIKGKYDVVVAHVGKGCTRRFGKRYHVIRGML